VGIFFVGKKTAKNSENKEQEVQNKKEIEKIQTKLQRAKSQLAAENNLVEKQKLQTEIDNLNQQLTKLKKGNNPTTPPTPNPPTNKIPHQLTVKYNTKVGGKHEYIDINNYKKRVLIDENNPIFASVANLTIKNNHYNISFDEEDISQKHPGGGFVFEANNTNFQLTPNVTPPQPNPSPPSNNPNQIEIEAK
jgi:hypothetical protein